MRAIVYTRVSTDAQERDGTSLETQVRACLDYAAAAGWSVVATVRDAASGFSLERPGMTRVRDGMRLGEFDVVLAYAVDRLSRHQNHIGVLFDEAEGWGVKFEFVTERFEDTAIGRFILAARAFTAEVEREKIAERTMRGKAERARAGKIPQATGKGIYGYRYNPATGRREIDHEQAEVVRLVFERFASGASVVGIADFLNERSIPTMQGKLWSPATVFHMLRREAYGGRTIYRRTKATSIRDPRTGKRRRKVVVRDEQEWIEVPDATPAIVAAEVFESVQARLNDPERLRQGRRTATYPLHGRMKCSVCGASMVGQTLKGRFRYYRCRRAFAGPRHDRCDSRYVRGELVEEAILEEAAAILASPELILGQLQRGAAQVAPTDVASVERRLAALDKQRERLVRLFQLGEVDEDYFTRESARVRAEQERLRASAAPVEIPARVLDAARLDELCAAVRTWLLGRADDDLELVAEALQLRITAHTDAAEVTGEIPEEYAPAWRDAHVRPVVSMSS
jgi:site-specific DNA recombinase